MIREEMNDSWRKTFIEFNEDWRFLTDVLKERLEMLLKENRRLQAENQRLREQVAWYQRVLFHIQHRETQHRQLPFL